MKVTFIIPGLEACLQAATGEEHTWLRRQLVRAARRSGPARCIHDLVLEVLPPLQGQVLPVAALEVSAMTGRVEKGFWMCGEPIGLTAQRAQLSVVSGSALQLESREAAELTDSLAALWAPEGFRVEAADPLCWYLRAEHSIRTPDYPAVALAGRDLYSELTQASVADESLPRLLTEVQMLFFDHPVNQRRRAAGRPCVDGVWFSGGGELTEPAPPALVPPAGEHRLAAGLRCWAGLPATAGHPEGAALWICRDAREHDSDAPPALAAALRRLHAGDLELVEVLDPEGEQWSVRRWHRLRRWRR